MPLYPFGFPGVNPGESIDPDPHAPGQVCPHCRGVETFFYHERRAAPQLICTDCLTGMFDTVDPGLPAPHPPLRLRLLGHLPGTTIGIYEYFFEQVADRGGAGEKGRSTTRSPTRPRRRRGKRA